jgi:hypothetical protein
LPGRAGASERPGEDPAHVRVDRAGSPPEGDRGHRPRGVRADPGKAIEGIDVVGHEAAVPIADRLGREPQV